MKSNESAGVGPLIGSIIIVLILIMGGYYSLTSRQTKNEEPVTQPVPIEETVATEAIPPVSTEIEDLSADAVLIDVAGADDDLLNIETAVQ